jgi:fructan beta-fructosidase
MSPLRRQNPTCDEIAFEGLNDDHPHSRRGKGNRMIRYRCRLRLVLAGLAALFVGLATPGLATPVQASAPPATPLYPELQELHAGDVTYQEPYRPQFHYTPARNWMNDPNGMVYYKGEYHLFYQYNPSGTTWGNISWGHAVSRDLVHWQELGVAIPHDDEEFVFSGSAVVDKENTSGFGTRQNPPLVAIYTSASKVCCRQAQALAYSLDHGRTWTKYAGNPVLDIGSGEFRDPKVFWYAPDQRWIMVVALSVERKVSIYASENLKDWEHLSNFGPANAVGGVWEVPDLFELPVNGNPRNKKWVMVVNINPGGIAGGSGAQYFVGDFDGTTFHADNIVGDYTPPAGDVYEDFEQSDYGGWSTTGTAFGSGPAPGSLPGQLPVTGFLGSRLVNSFDGGDTATGTLTSPTFRISRGYINLLVGGGSHAHQPGTVDTPPPPGTVFADFEGGSYGEGWTATGTFAGTTPPAGTIGDQQPVSGYEGEHLVNTFIDHDNGTGTITSPEFTIASNYINLLVGGGSHPYPGDPGNPPTSVNLVVDGQVVHTATGQDSEQLNWVNWDVSARNGQTAHIQIVDQNTGGWGHILADHIMFADQPARPRSYETAVNLLVDGEVVRSASGQDSEQLDWAAWNVNDLIGKDAQIQIVDRNSGAWGHILADHVMFADDPAQSILQRSSWLDYGKDYYAAISWNNVPGDKRIMIGWMNNWQYAGVIPTSPWRSAMSVPRQVALRTIDGRVQVVQEPIHQLHQLRRGPAYRMHNTVIPEGTQELRGRGAHGKALEIIADFDVRTAQKFGLKVRTGEGEETVIGYDVDTAELYVDRTRSGNVGFNRNFPGVQRAPLTARNGEVHLRILVDWSSVEVFADHGQIVITDQIFPSGTSDGVKLFAEGGNVKLTSLKIWQLRSIWMRPGRG